LSALHRRYCYLASRSSPQHTISPFDRRATPFRTRQSYG
jgi:hypothetical protein